MSVNPKKKKPNFEKEIRAVFEKMALGSMAVQPPIEWEGMDVQIFDPGILNKSNAEKVYRLNGKNTKSSALKDPQLRDNIEFRAGIYGLSFDELVSREFDLMGETILNLHPEAIESFKRYKREKIWETAHVHQHQNEDGKSYYRIYRKSLAWNSKRDTRRNKEWYRFDSEKIEIHLRLPNILHQELFGTKGDGLFKEISRQKFIRGLFDSFLMNNNIQLPSAIYMTDSYLGELEVAIDKIGAIESWKPYGWMSPPLRHPIDDVIRKFSTYRYLRTQDHRILKEQFENIKFFKGTVVFFFQDLANKQIDVQKFDTIRDLLPYIQERLWRSSSSFFTLLLLQFLTEKGLFNPQNNTIPRNFAENFSTHLATISR